MQVIGATVVKMQPPVTVKKRLRPIRELIMDTSVPAGVREYTDNQIIIKKPALTPEVKK